MNTLHAVMIALALLGLAGVTAALRLAGAPCPTCRRPRMDCDGHGPHEYDPATRAADYAATVRAGHLESVEDWAARTGTDPARSTR